MTQEELYEIRRTYAKSTNQSRFTINAVSRNDTYSKNKDKDGLSVEKRKVIEEIKEKQAYPGDDLNEVWE